MAKTSLTTLSVACALVMSTAAAKAGEFAEAVKSGALSRAEALRDQGQLVDQEDAAAACSLLFWENKLIKAKACLAPGLAANPDDKGIWGAMAFAAFHRGDFASAATAYERAGNALKAAEARALASAPSDRMTSAGAVYLVPFERTDPLPVVKVRLSDGKDHLFVIDTGAAETVLDPRLAATLKIPVAGEASAGPVIRYGVLDKLTMGELVMERVPVQIYDTSRFTRAMDGSRVDGAIGVNLLRHFVATIDYPHARLHLRTVATEQVPAPDAVPFWMAGDHLLLAEGSIDGAAQLAMLDTGLTEVCAVPKSTLDQIHATSVDDDLTRHRAAGESGAVAQFNAATLTLAGKSETNRPCIYGPFPAPLEDGAGSHIGLLFSHGFLSAWAVTFDFRAMKMWLEPRVHVAPPPAVPAPAKPAKAATKPHHG